MSEYFTNGVQVYDLDRCLAAIKQRNYDNELKISKLREENEKLRSEQYKDEQLKELNTKLEKANADLNRGFPITEFEEKKIKMWMERHEEEAHGLNTPAKKILYGGTIGGRYSYHFIPTALGTFATVRCSCGAEFDFSDI